MKQWRALLVFLTAILLSGCAGKQAAPNSTQEPGKYQIYYLNAPMTKLVAHTYETETTDTGALIDELMEQFTGVPADVESQVALSEKVTYQGYKRQDIVLYLYFDNNYTSMQSTREILCRAALAKTMTQIPGIDFINIYSGDQPLLNADQSPVGMLTATDFVDSISDVNAFERTELTLYFTDEAGEKLYAEKREVMHNINTSVERVVLDELIKGPQQSGLFPTLDSKTGILNVSVNENVCYINFNGTFLTNSLEIKDYIPIYSITNSLAALSSVNRVQISVNGVKDGAFRDSISLNTLFERNLDYIGGE